MKYVLILLFFIVKPTLFAQDKVTQDLLLINSLRNYEMNAHSTFQKELYLSSDNFIRTQSEKFVDNETGFFKLWAEVFSFYESDTKKNARWKNRIEKYFRATAYQSYIIEKQNNYAARINQQRKELLGKLHHLNKNLVIKSKDVTTVNISNETLNKIIKQVNSLVLVEVIPEVIESLLVPLIISLIGMIFGVFLAGKTKGLIFVIALLFSIWQSIKYSNELERQINESFAITKNNQLNVLDELQKNSTEYYTELIKKIQK